MSRTAAGRGWPQRLFCVRAASNVRIAAIAAGLPRGTKYAHALENNLLVRKEDGIRQPCPDIGGVEQLGSCQLPRTHTMGGLVKLMVARNDNAVLKK